jgi:sugar (pentulose or hexulose) kinase
MSSRLPVILIFDAGKTNKKVLLFDEKYNVVYEEACIFPETTDEDGYPCEDIHRLKAWVADTYFHLRNDERFAIRAIHFSAYGASMVYLDEQLREIPPLYNYLKPFPEDLSGRFYTTYGGESVVCRETASPRLGSLNSGLQLYRIKFALPEKFARIRYALHLPQYLSFILTGKVYSEITSIGCHTHLWDFSANNYHRWVTEEGIGRLLPQLQRADAIAGYTADGVAVGVGLHDSSAALTPYLRSFPEPFVLISTGTWCISLNPFNQNPLTDTELKQDCLCYLTWEGRQVKASRLFAGHHLHLQQMRINKHFSLPAEHPVDVRLDIPLLNSLMEKGLPLSAEEMIMKDWDLSCFSSYEEAYFSVMIALVELQARSTDLILAGCTVSRIFVDGGFTRNSVYLYLLAKAYPNREVYAAEVPQASALGAARVMHAHWNPAPKPDDLVAFRRISL